MMKKRSGNWSKAGRASRLPAEIRGNNRESQRAV